MIRALVVALAVAGAPALATAATIHVNGGTVGCTNAAGNGTLGAPYASLYRAMTQAGVTCGDTVELHGGAPYRPAYTDAFNSSAGTAAGRYAQCDANEIDDPGGDDAHTVLPIFQDCPSTGPPLVIQNYCAGPGNCDNVILDGTPGLVDTLTWQQCTATSCCGVGGLALANPTATWCTTQLNFGSIGWEMQWWADASSASDPGTRLHWAADGPGVVYSGNAADHDTIGPNEFFHVNGLNVVRFADGASPATHRLYLGAGAGHGAGPVVSFYDTSGIVLRRNPLGGSITVRGGSSGLGFSGSALGSVGEVIVDGVDVHSNGGKEYGQNFRISNGQNVTVRNSFLHDTMAECGAAYGGSHQAGNQIRGITITGNTIRRCGLASVDGGGDRIGCDLGMGVIVKNGSDVVVADNDIEHTYRSGIEVTTSPPPGSCSTCTGCGGTTCFTTNVTIARNRIRDFCHHLKTTSPHACGTNAQWPVDATSELNSDCAAIEVKGASNPSAMTIDSNVVDGTANPTPTSPGGPNGIFFDAPVTGGVIINNTLRKIYGAAINVEPAGTNQAVIRNNLMDECGLGNADVCGGNGPCCLYTRDTTSHVHESNTYWAAAAATRVYRSQNGTNRTRSDVTLYEPSAVQAAPAFADAAGCELSSTSGVIDAGTNTTCSGRLDAHGVVRPLGAKCDVGACEYGPTPTGATPTQTPGATRTPTPTPTLSATPTSTPTPTTTFAAPQPTPTGYAPGVACAGCAVAGGTL